MIVSTRDRRTAELASGKTPKGFPSNLVRATQRKLFMLEQAVELRDLASPPGNRLEALHGDRRGQHSIRINAQWRICFIWRADGAHDVEIVGYH